MNRRLVVANALLLCFLVGGCSDSTPGGPGDGLGGTDSSHRDAVDSQTDLTGDTKAGDGGQGGDGIGDGASDGSDGSSSDGGGGGTWQVVPATVKAGACCLDAVWGGSLTGSSPEGLILYYH